MAAITFTSTQFRLVETTEQATAPAAVAITAGQTIKFDTAGKWILADASDIAGLGLRCALAIRTVAISEALTGLYQGVVDLGALSTDFAALAFDAGVYASDTAGGLDTAAGTVSRLVGTVVPGWASTTADKLLRVCL